MRCRAVLFLLPLALSFGGPGLSRGDSSSHPSDADPPEAAVAELSGTVAKDPRELPPGIGRRGPRVVRVHLVAREQVAELAPGKHFWFWGFAEVDAKGEQRMTVPGPMIRARQGDLVEIQLTNASTNLEPHNLDLHAGIGAMLHDIHPGETRTLRFVASREGAYVYHCAAEGAPWEHVAYGMYGLILVEPRGGLPRADHEFYLGQSEWYLKPGVEDLPGVDAFSLDEDKALDERPDHVTFNGHTRALTDPGLFGDAIEVRRGDRVRIFFVNGGPNLGSNLHVIGNIFDRATPGHRANVLRNEETLHVPPGSAATLELRALASGEFPIVDHALFRMRKGAHGLLHVR